MEDSASSTSGGLRNGRDWFISTDWQGSGNTVNEKFIEDLFVIEVGIGLLESLLALSLFEDFFYYWMDLVQMFSTFN